MEIYRQGDILLKKLNKKPDLKNLKKLDIPVVLGHGEVTGHLHQIKSNAVLHSTSPKNVEVFAITGVVDEPIFLEIESNTELVHEEHGPIALSPGWYEPTRQREYSPERLRYVSD